MSIYDIIDSLVDEGAISRKDRIEIEMKLENHTRSISFHDEEGRSYYWTVTSDGKRIQRKTKKKLLQALAEHYKTLSPTIEEVFEMAIETKIKREHPNAETIRAIRIDYNKYIKGLASYKINELDDVFVSDYIINTIHSLSMSEKQLKKLKSVLNLIFDYATDKKVNLTSERPYDKSNKIYKKHCTVNVIKAEDKAFQPDDIATLRAYLFNRINLLKYDHNGLMILFSMETGMRSAELCALKWKDISERSIRIHSQIVSEVTEKGHREYRYEPSTKNEKGVSKGGRVFPNTDAMKEILSITKALQEKNNIKSEYVFCNSNGDFSNGDAYRKALEAVCDKLHLRVKNNHAIRMYFNSYVLLEKCGFTVEKRAKLLGHSPEVNMKYYTFMRKEDDFVIETMNVLNNANHMPTTIISFPTKREALETASF